MYKVNSALAYLSVLVIFFFQILLIGFFNFEGTRPDVILLATIFFALFTDARLGLRVGFLSGLLLDIVSIRLPGMNTALYALCGYVVGKYNGKFYKESAITHFIITLTASIFILTVLFLSASLPHLEQLLVSGDRVIFHSAIFTSSLFNAILSIWAYPLFSRLFKLGEKEL